MSESHLKQLRMARGYSLEDLAEHVGNISRQMIHKYERGVARPTGAVAVRLAAALGVDRTALLTPPAAGLSCASVGYRHYHGVPKKEISRIEKTLLLTVEPRLEIQSILLPDSHKYPRPIPVRNLADVEAAALRIRHQWDIGSTPIANLVGILEDRGIQVIPMKTDSRFDGTAVVVKDKRGRRVGWAVVARTETCAERQRLSLAHELGHLVLVPREMKEETAAFAFAGAFLAPADTVRRKVGMKRSEIRTEELLLLKCHFGMSIQALLFRLWNLGIISKPHFVGWYRTLSRRGWRTKEPNETPAEETSWLKHAILRLRSEHVKASGEIRHLFATSPERKEVEALLRSERSNKN